MLMPASVAGVVEKDRVAAVAPTALTVSPAITVSVGDVPSLLGPPELPPHPTNKTHSHIGLVIVKVRGIAFYRWVVSTWSQYTTLAVAAVTGPHFIDDLTALSFL